MKKIILVVVVILVVLGGYFIFRNFNFNKESGQANISENIPNGEEQVAGETEVPKIEILKEGTGEGAKAGDEVVVHYTGTFENNEKFDSSTDRGEPFSFILGQGEVIEGWELGILGMKKGEKRKLTIPPNLAYGENGIPGFIPQKATLIFEVELLEIK